MIHQKIVVALLALFCFASYFSFLATCLDLSDCSHYHGCQGYLYGVPTHFKTRGLNVLEAHKIANNRGEEARVIIVECANYESTHPDLPEPELILAKDDLLKSELISAELKLIHQSHATMSAGVILGQAKKWGITGIAPKAKAGSVDGDLANELLFHVKKGDVIASSIEMGTLTKLHLNPLFDFPGRMEDLTTTLTKEMGVHVVQSAGNHYRNYDELWASERLTSEKPKDTGIILVGAIDPETGKKPKFSNYGSRILLYAWGYDVTTTDLNGGCTQRYKGTSAAAPQIAGCVTLLQSTFRAIGLGDLEPERAGQILYDSGDEILFDELEDTPDIGRLPRMPDMVKAIGLLHPSLGPVRKRGRSLLFRFRFRDVIADERRLGKKSRKILESWKPLNNASNPGKKSKEARKNASSPGKKFKEARKNASSPGKKSKEARKNASVLL